MNKQTSITLNRTIIWLVGVFFLLFQFFLQLSSGIIVGVIMKEQNLSALMAGLLSSSFYYVYTTMQIPVGLLFDRYNTQILLAGNAALCALGCFIFSTAHTLPLLFLGRLVIGGGSAFAFIGLSHLLRQHYPLKQYAFMIGLSETLGFTATVLGMIGMGSFINILGWRSFITSAGVIGMLIAFLCWNIIPRHTPDNSLEYSYKTQFILILKNKLAWVNGLFVCLEFSVITVFGAMWAVPFLELKLQCGIKTASVLTSMILLGAGLSCPLFGLLSMYFSKRNPLIHASCLTTAVLVLIALFLPINNVFLMGALMFTIGLSCGAYMLAYTISNELAPAKALSTCTGFTNTLAMIAAPLLQPLIGFFLDYLSGKHGEYSLENYQVALLVIPGALVLASILVCFLPEKESQLKATL